METEIEEKNKHAKNSFLYLIIVTIIVSFLFYPFLRWIISKNHINNYCQLSKDNTDSLFEISNDDTLIFSKDAFHYFEENCLGNTNVILLSYGSQCERNGVICESKENATWLIKNGEKKIISSSPSSYINIIGDVVYYRNDQDRKLYRYSMTTNNGNCIVQSPCGETVVTTKGISYIDLESQILKYMPFSTMEATPITSDRVNSFAIIGENYYCLKSNKDFGIITNTNNFKIISQSVDRFFCNGNVVIQKGSNIYFVNDIYNIESSMTNIDGKIVGMYDDSLFIMEGSKLNEYNISNQSFKKTIFELPTKEVLKAFYCLQESFEVISYEKENSLYKPMYRSIEK